MIKLLEALLRRIPQNHSKRSEIEVELSKYRAGFKGEQSLDYYLDFLPEQDFLILHGLRLPFKDYHFQIDTLMLSRSFFLLIEVKNIGGNLLFEDTYKQFLRILDNGEKEVYKEPVQQVKMQQFQLSYLLNEWKFPSIPIEHLVVFANPKAILQTSNPSSEYTKKVITSPGLLDKINEIKTRRKEEYITGKDLRKIARNLIKKHVPAKPDIYHKFEISPSDIKPGVFCSNCDTTCMRRKSGRWICTECKSSSLHAHIEALEDYSFLISSKITNRQAREYLHISSRTTMHRILKEMNLKHTGSKKNRAYVLEFDL